MSNSDKTENKMNRRRFSSKSTFGALVLGLAPHAFAMGSEGKDNPPNIVLFLSDDHAQRDLSNTEYLLNRNSKLSFYPKLLITKPKIYEYDDK